MSRSLRRRFLLITMLSLTGTFLLLGTAINVGNYRRITARIDAIIDVLYENDWRFPSAESNPDLSGGFQITEETAFETRYCIARISADRKKIEIDTAHIAALDQENVPGIVESILDSGHSKGYLGYYRYHCYDEPGGETAIVIVDCFLQLQTFYAVLQLTLLVFTCSIVVVFLLLCLLSGYVIRPFSINMEKQKRFITDISHELKTPLGIISANMGVVELTKGKDEWTESTKNQVQRMDRLIAELIELSKAEETACANPPTVFSVSALAEETAGNFLTLAKSQGKKFSTEIETDLNMKGQREQILRLLTILTDNAVKYCDPGGTVHLELRQKRRQIILRVSNPCENLDASKLPLLFERFYRADASRARSSGGYGIGLSIARSVAERHKGKLTASFQNGIVTFTATLPRS